MEPPRIVVLGGINMDLVATVDRFPKPGETVVGRTFTTYAGGKGANQAVAAARLGAQVSMVGRVGDDAFGQQLRDGLAAEGIDVSGVGVEAGAASGIALIQIDASAQNRIVQVWGANRSCGAAEVEQVVKALPALPALPALQRASALLLQLETPMDVSLRAAQAAHDHGCKVVLDPAPAPAEGWPGLPPELYSLCDCITPNESEAEALVGFPIVDTASAHRAAGVLMQRGARSAVIKLGERGAYFLSPFSGMSGSEGSGLEGAGSDGPATLDGNSAGDSGHVPAFAVDAVDTVAAGDAFNAALAVALAEGLSLAESVQWAVAAGAVAVTRAGAQDAMPYRHEVDALLQGGSAR